MEYLQIEVGFANNDSMYHHISQILKSILTQF